MSEEPDFDAMWTSIVEGNDELAEIQADGEFAVPFTLYHLSANIGTADIFTLALLFPDGELQEWCNLVHHALALDNVAAQEKLHRWVALVQDGITTSLESDPAYYVETERDDEDD